MATTLQLIAPGPLESTALCAAFASAGMLVQGLPACSTDAEGRSSFTAGGLTFPVALLTAPETQVLMDALQGKLPFAVVGLDPATDPDQKSIFASHDQLLASRDAEHLFVTPKAGSNASEPIAYLAVRAFVALASQVIASIGDQLLGGDYGEVYKRLLANGFQPPAGWTTYIGAVGAPNGWVVNTDLEATSTPVGIAYDAAYHGLQAAEAAVPGTEAYAPFQAVTPVPVHPVLGNWESAVANAMPSDPLGISPVEKSSVTLPGANGQAFIFNFWRATGTKALVESGTGQVGVVLGKSLSSLGEAWAKLQWQLMPPGSGPGPILKPMPPVVIVTPAPATTPPPATPPAPAEPVATPAASPFPWGWVLGAAAIAGAGVGVALYLKHQQQPDIRVRQVPTEPRPVPQLEPGFDDRETLVPERAANPVKRASRYFEFRGGKSSKYWEIARKGNLVGVHFGRIGTNGQTQYKEHASKHDAKHAMKKLIAQKTGKGYVEI